MTATLATLTVQITASFDRPLPVLPFVREMAAIDALTDEQFAADAAKVLALAEAVPPATAEDRAAGVGERGDE